MMSSYGGFVATTILAVARGGNPGDGYGSGIAKSTYSASDPIANFAFMTKYLPVHCQDAFTTCNDTFKCGTSGRGALCTDDACTYDNFGAFGIHTVNLTARPHGGTDNIDVENHFYHKLQTGFKAGMYDSFMDYSLVLYAASLDHYVAAFEADHVPHLMLQWNDDMGQLWFSLIVQVAKSQLVLELVSSDMPNSASAHMIEDDLQRLPASIFASADVHAKPLGVVTPLAVSRATSSMEAVQDFYVNDLFSTVNHTQSVGDIAMKAYLMPGASALMRFIQRPSSATAPGFTVADLEAAKHAAHRMAMDDEFCGVDKWIDNHVALDQSMYKLDAFKANFDSHNIKYHVFGDCTNSTKPGPGTNMYVVDPTGDSVQLDGQWVQCPQGGSGDALQNPCSQGVCTQFAPSAQCSQQLDTLCARLEKEDDTCTDCAYGKWEELASVGCTNADVVNYCVGTSNMLAV